MSATAKSNECDASAKVSLGQSAGRAPAPTDCVPRRRLRRRSLRRPRAGGMRHCICDAKNIQLQKSSQGSLVHRSRIHARREKFLTCMDARRNGCAPLKSGIQRGQKCLWIACSRMTQRVIANRSTERCGRLHDPSPGGRQGAECAAAAKARFPSLYKLALSTNAALKLRSADYCTATWLGADPIQQALPELGIYRRVGIFYSGSAPEPWRRSN